MQWTRDDYVVTDDRARLDLAVIHAFIAGESYWAAGIPEAVLARAIDNSLCFGLYRGASQVGFARVVTDHSTYAYLCDVFVDSAHRGRELGKWLVECVVAHPDLQGLRRFCLMTRDAHELYKPFGFKPMADSTRYLEIHRPGAYQQREDSHG
jgi:ribosomal protein S18 acetylase RimI-like enzyme